MSRRPGMVLASCAGLVALSLALPIVATAAGTKPADAVSFRAVLCFAPALATTQSSPPSGGRTASIPACAPPYRLTAKNLDVNVNVGTSKTIGPDPIFRHTPNTSSAKVQLTSDVLLPGLSGARGTPSTERYVLGPVQMTSSSIQSANVKKLYGQWAVSYQLTPSGDVVWNSFAKRQFHALIAIVANGVVYSAPLIQPMSTTFTSFGRSGLITGNFTKAEASYLANLL